MPIVRGNFIAGKMNKSIDERLVPVGEYIDALNVRLGSTEGTEIGAVENSKGNNKLSSLQYAGAPLTDNATTIGVFEDGINETLYWFIHDEENPNSVVTGVVDMVVSFNTNSSALVYHVVSTQVLNFNPKYLITGVSKIENLLFFTDDINPPRMINVSRNYSEPVSGLDTILEEEDLSVIVKPPGFEDYDPLTQLAPLGTPNIELVELLGEENYIETRFISFAYRYRYEDGQYSATSLFSTPAFEPSNFDLSQQNYWNEGMQNKFNACNVTFSTGSRRVKEVQLLYKQTTSNVIYVIKRYVKGDVGWADNEFKTVQFTNSEIYTTLGSDELLRLYDNVPHTAKAQTIQGNRLIYGNYVDGYDISSTEGGSDVHIDYAAEPSSEEFTGIELGNHDTTLGALNPSLSTGTYTIAPGASVDQNDSVLTWDLSSILPSAGAIPIGTTLDFNFSIDQNELGIEFLPGSSNSMVFSLSYQPSPIYISMTFTTTTSYNTVEAMLSSQEFKDRIGGSINQGFSSPNIVRDLYPCNESINGSTLSDKFYSDAESPMIPTTPSLAEGLFYLYSGGVDSNGCDIASSATLPFPATCSTSTIASGATDNTVVISGQMTDTSVNFLTSGVSVGDVVFDTVTSLQAEVIGVTTNTLSIIDITPGAVSNLELSGVNYNVITGGNSPAPCPADGFKYTNTGSTFSIQLPATEWLNILSPTDYSVSYRYYNFVQFDCTGFLSKDISLSSLHSNRDYEVGVVYMDDYGRASTVLTSDFNTVFFPPSSSVLKNKIKVTLNNLPPYWATKYKFVVKPSEGSYNTIFSSVFYKQDGSAESSVVLPVAEIPDESQVWFKLDGQNSNIINVGDELIVKQDMQGFTSNQQKAVVLAVESFPSKGITSDSLGGLYMLLKPEGWTVDSDESLNYFYGQKEYNNNSTSFNNGGVDDYSLNDSSGVPYTIPKGSRIRIKIRAFRKGDDYCPKSITYDRTFISTDDYTDFWAWTQGAGLASMMSINSPGVSDLNGMDIHFLPDIMNQNTPSVPYASNNFSVLAQVRRETSGSMFFTVNAALQKCKKKEGKLRVTIEVTRTPGVVVFETSPQEVDDNIFYDASNLLDIEQGYHQAKRDFTPNPAQYSLSTLSQDQTATLPLITLLDAHNCYSFGNGVESYKVYDSPAGKSFNLGERALAVSNQDFKEADRFAGLTYSGIYSSSANVNNLNEFNLGLVNYKDLETSFGPIQKLHARQTDILTLQEDRISYVQSGKNLIVDAVGGGAITSVPKVLGDQIARIEEYGISFNPESFVSWGSDMYFTDTKRGAIINLRGGSVGSDQLQVISKLGMNTWFRDTFNAQLTTQKLGGYDPYMNEYVLGTNLNPVPVPVDVLPCGQTVAHTNSSAEITFDVSLGEVIETVDIPYTVTSGSIDISITWNGLVVASVTGATVSGSLTFEKTLTTPTTCSVTITPTETSNYTLSVGCPDRIPLTVIQVVRSSNNYNGEFTHINYNWTDGTVVSPSLTPPPAISLTYNQPSYYNSDTGVRSIGMFPYDGSDITIKSLKQFGIDDFDFIPATASNPTGHKFRILSSNTLYSNTEADTDALIAASQWVAPVLNPSTGVYEATSFNTSMPIGNQYLYLIWDLRLVSSQTVCFCDTGDTINDVCCNCTASCQNVFIGPYSPTQVAACTTDVDSPQKGDTNVFSFLGNSGIPTLGDVVYESDDCSAPTKAPGFYIVSPVSPSVSPKTWIEIGSLGVVIANGTC